MYDNKSQLKFDDSNDYSVSELIYVILKHKKLILALFFSLLFFCILYTFTTTPYYKSTTTIIVSEDQGSMSFLDMNFGQERNYIDNEITILKSRTVSDLVVKELLNQNKHNNLKIFLGINESKLDFLFDAENIDKLSKKIRDNLTIMNSRNTDVISISMISNNKNNSALILNTLVSVYQKLDLAWANGEMSHLKLFLIEQLEIKEQELLEIENDLKEFQEKEKIFGLDNNSEMLLENLTNIETKYYNTMTALDIANEREKYLMSQLSEDEEIFIQEVSSTMNAKLFALRDELTTIEVDIVSTIAEYGENHIAVKANKEKLKRIKENINKETTNLVKQGISVSDPILFRQGLMDSIISIHAIKSNLNSRVKSYKKLVDDYNDQLINLPNKILDYTRLERARTIHSESFKFMSNKLEEARIGEASKLGKIRIIDEAIPKNDPVKPNKPLYCFVGLILSLIFSISIAFLIEFFDNTINSIEQLERRGLSILAIIPSITNYENNNKNKNKYLRSNQQIKKLQRRLITEENPKSPVSEAYRGLRTSLMYTSLEKKDSLLILVSSAGPGEGKTTTIANLAITYANLGKKVLLVDSDLRKPVVHSIFDIDKSPGLTSYLSGNSSFNDISNKSKIDNLNIVTSGIIPPNPSELLNSNKMKEFISSAKEEYDLILFDTPPLIAVTDAFVLLKYIDQFLLVVRSGRTQKGALERALTVSKQSNAKIAGVVMNAVSEINSYGSGYYYNYYQYYYGDDKA